MSEPPTLSVRGEATLEVEPDLGVLHVLVRGQDAVRDLATATVAATADAVRDALAGVGGVRRTTLSSLRVEELMDWDDKGVPRSRGWQADVSGRCEVDASAVSEAAAALLAAGGRLTSVEWQLDPGSTGPREVRARAVADAARAAQDFADALGATVGALVHLADPGLLGSGSPGVGLARAIAARGGGPGDVELDPPPVVLQAQVEARYLLDTPTSAAS